MRFLIRFSFTALHLGVILLLGAFLLTATLSFFPSFLSSLPHVSYTKEGWMRGEIAVLGQTIPVDFRNAADFFSRFRKEGAPDPLENALKAVSSDIVNAFFAAFGRSTDYVPDDAVLA